MVKMGQAKCPPENPHLYGIEDVLFFGVWRIYFVEESSDLPTDLSHAQMVPSDAIKKLSYLNWVVFFKSMLMVQSVWGPYMM